MYHLTADSEVVFFFVLSYMKTITESTPSGIAPKTVNQNQDSTM